MKYAFALAALVTSLAMPAYAAEPFPNRPVRLVVPFPAGGATDVVARMIAQKAGDQAGQPFIVDITSDRSEVSKKEQPRPTVLRHDEPVDGPSVTQCGPPVRRGRPISIGRCRTNHKAR